jgi:hypothetical protein
MSEDVITVVKETRWCEFGFYVVALTSDGRKYIIFGDELEEDE